MGYDKPKGTADTLPPTNAPAPVNTAELPPGTVVGEYRVERKIGEGGMASVYAAIHPLIHKNVAVKVMNSSLSADSSAVERFVQEARAVNQINHPNIVDIFSFGKLQDGRSYFVMEWLQGETLYERLRKRHLSLSESVEILFQVSDALEAAHEKGIVHRDLKPENLFLVPLRDDRTLVKLLDFGIAKLLGVADTRAQRTQANLIMGTPRYLSPEQARASSIDHRTDIYSLGVIAFEMILHRAPFVAEHAIDEVRMHLSDPPPRPSALWPEIPPYLESMLLQLLAKEADGRPTLQQFRNCLAEVRDTILVPGRGGSRRETLPPQGQPSATLPATLDDDASLRATWKRPIVISSSVVVAIGILTVLSWPHRSAPPIAPVAPPSPPAVVERAEPVPIVPVATLVIGVNVHNAHVELDGRAVADSVADAQIPVPSAGPHSLVVTAPGRRPFHKTVTLRLGETVTVTVKLRSEEKAAQRKPANNGYYMLDPLGKTQVR